MDPRRRRTRDRLQAALREALDTQKISGISVEMLAKSAGVTRQTFYANYGSVDDLLREYLDAHLGDLKRRHEGASADDGALEARIREDVGDLLHRIDRDDSRLRAILDGQAGFSPEDRFAGIVEGFMRQDSAGRACDETLTVRAQFYGGAFIGTLRYWVLHREGLPADALAALFAGLVVRGAAAGQENEDMRA